LIHRQQPVATEQIRQRDVAETAAGAPEEITAMKMSLIHGQLSL
jgi:hypothetical protein